MCEGVEEGVVGDAEGVRGAEAPESYLRSVQANTLASQEPHGNHRPHGATRNSLTSQHPHANDRTVRAGERYTEIVYGEDGWALATVFPSGGGSSKHPRQELRSEDVKTHVRNHARHPPIAGCAVRAGRYTDIVYAEDGWAQQEPFSTREEVGGTSERVCGSYGEVYE